MSIERWMDKGVAHIYDGILSYKNGWNKAVSNIVIVAHRSVLSDFVTPWTAARQVSLSFIPPGACSNSCPLSRWCHPTISSSVVPFSSCLQSFPASASFLKSQLFASGGESHLSFSIGPSNEYSELVNLKMIIQSEVRQKETNTRWHLWRVCVLSWVWLFATAWTVASQAPLDCIQARTLE